METSELPIKSMPSTLEQICSKYGANVSYEKLLSMLCQSLGSVKLKDSKFCQVRMLGSSFLLRARKPPFTLFLNKNLKQASTYQLREEVDDAPHDTGPLGAIQRLQGLSNRTPSQVLQSWNNLNLEERQDIEQPSALWIVSVDKTHELSDLDIVSFPFT